MGPRATIQILLTGRDRPARYTVEVVMGVARAFSLEDLPGPACLLAEDGRIAAHNAAFEAWAGRADVEGRPLAALFPGDPGVVRLAEDARHGPVEHHVQRRARTATGASFWSLRAAPTAEGVIVCATDITAFAQAAQALHTAQRDYVAMAVHELRAPLAAIKAWAGALGGRARTEDGDPPSAAVPATALPAEGLAAIGRKVDQIDELITDLLEVARSDAAAVRPAREAVTVDALVRRALDASPYGARVSIEGALPGRVRVDASHLEIALGKVIASVARRQADGPIAVAAEAAGGEVHVLVGEGGSSEAEAADPFGRATRFGRGRGAGLGLYLAQQLVTANGGRAWREPHGGGARFVLALPAVVGDAPEVPSQEAPPQPFARVLLVEPDAARRARTAAVLRLAGHDVTPAAAPPPAPAGAFDLVIADASTRNALDSGGPAGLILVGPEVARIPPGSAERSGALAVIPDPLDLPRLVALVAGVAVARIT
jgi:signal transduction histidine kinase